MKALIIQPFLLDIEENNCYILVCARTRTAAVIDPGEWNVSLETFIRDQRVTLRWVLLTHGHADHVGGIAEVKKLHQVQVMGSKLSRFADRKLGDGETVELGALKVQGWEIPGHTEDSMAFVVERTIFSGDALFAGSVGGTSDAQRFAQQAKAIKEKIFPLGDDCVVLPGHGPATTVRIERLFNPFLLDSSAHL